MEKLKIAVVIPTHSEIHSSLNNLLKVYSHLAKKKGVEVTIFTDKRNEAGFSGLKVQKISGVDHKTLLEKILFVMGLPRCYYLDLVEKLSGYDIIESSNPEFYGFAYQCYIAARRYHARLVYRTSQTVDGFYLFKFTKYIVTPFARNAYRYAKFLLFSNPDARERCIRLGLERDARKLVVIGHATDTKCFRPMKSKPHNGTILLSVGGLYKIKGHHLIMQALKKIIDRGCTKSELWIVGDGRCKEHLKGLALGLGIADKVRFLGKKTHLELAKIYNRSDIFVLANYQEVTPAVNEAMACGKPVVAMECGGLRFAVPSDEFGLVSKKFDVEDMAGKIELLIRNKELAARIAKNGRSHVLKNFSIEHVAEKIYKSFVD